jgi:hypothetical protein
MMSGAFDFLAGAAATGKGIGCAGAGIVGADTTGAGAGAAFGSGTA